MARDHNNGTTILLGVKDLKIGERWSSRSNLDTKLRHFR